MQPWFVLAVAVLALSLAGGAPIRRGTARSVDDDGIQEPHSGMGLKPQMKIVKRQTTLCLDLNNPPPPDDCDLTVSSSESNLPHIEFPPNMGPKDHHRMEELIEHYNKLKEQINLPELKKLHPKGYRRFCSMRAIVDCFQKHCGGNLVVFRDKHPSLPLCTFFRNRCSGSEVTCNTNKLKQLRAECRKRARLNKQIMEEKSKDETASASSPPNADLLAGITHIDKDNIQDLVKYFNQTYWPGNHRVPASFNSSMYYSMRAIAKCYQNHFGGDWNRFRAQHGSLPLSSFRRLYCSGEGSSCDTVKLQQLRSERRRRKRMRQLSQTMKDGSDQVSDTVETTNPGSEELLVGDRAGPSHTPH